MTTLQFRVLYREFLFRMVDLELLSAHAHGDMSRLFGQFAALFGFIGLLFAGVGLQFAQFARKMRPEARLAFSWTSEHFLIATTMLIVGLLTVLSWDSTFPDRRDVLVLAPLPVRARTMFRAKLAALGTALGVAVGTLHVLAGFAWPLGLAQSAGVVSLIRAVAAYWLTMLLAGAFILCSVLCLQGLAAQLPRRYFLRLSSMLQMAAFTLFVSVYFLQPLMPEPQALVRNSALLLRLPSYWFLGLFQSINGSLTPLMEPFARRGWIAVGVSTSGAAVAFLLSYFRTLRKIVEEPDIVPGSGGARWLPGFGGAVETAIVQFSIRTLMRSRLHRVILAFYAGVGFAFTIGFLKTPHSRSFTWRQVNVPMLASSILMLGFWAVGTRVVFSMPLDLRANWIFRLMPMEGGSRCLAARRRSQVALGVAPVWLGSAAVLLYFWPWSKVLGHLAMLTLLGMLIVELSLGGIQKIPFTCSYLPGRSNFHLTFWLSIGMVMMVVAKTAQLEARALASPAEFAAMVLALGAAILVARWRSAPDPADPPVVEFEQAPSDEIVVLGLSGIRS